MKSRYRILYLFDIDGTLADMEKVHVKAYQMAYKNVLGFVPGSNVISRQFGNVERQIHEAIFTHYKIRDRKKVSEVIRAYTKFVAAAVKKSKVRTLPGARRIISELARKKQLLGVVTGNSRKIGQAILRKIKLLHYFKIQSYGAVDKRAHIVRTAIQMAKKKGLKFDKVIVFGDSVFDVHAAKENKALSVAIATGKYSLEELKKEKPDLALKSLRDYAAMW